MKVRLHVRSGRSETTEFAERLSATLESHGIAADEAAAEADMVVAVGGDGTMLSAVELAVAMDVPVLGFNLGTIGFLTAADPSELEAVSRRLADGDYGLEERMTVAATVGGRTIVGVNDVVIEKVDSQRLIELNVKIDGVEFVNYRADGLIVATPTGSTAYSFSAGGPLVSPTLHGFVVTAVAALRRFCRMRVILPEDEILITVTRDRPVKVSVDKTGLGQLGPGDEVSVRRGEKPVQFVTLDPPSFAGLVRHKFDLP
mgnify:CR=1 FL=1